MCGINGIWKSGNQASAIEKMAVMNRAIAHRGPDADGSWSNNDIVLGHRRLSIIDTSAAGNQPFFSDDKQMVIVFNGEIYNYIELRKELETDCVFHTGTDTEVILAAYRKWGIQCIERFIGMFAFALCDLIKGKYFLVRDRLGIKPVYYSQTSNGFLFSSEIRALLSTGWVERKLDEDALCDYLRYQTVHAPRTIIRGVNMLMPGHYIEFSEGGAESRCYWSLAGNAKRDAEGKSIKKIHSEIHDILQSAVEIRMRADVPFGAFLSGGIDSSAIVGLMSEVSDHPVKTFSVTFHEKQYDESPYSKLIAKRFKTDHTEIRLNASDFLGLIPDALDAMDHPGGDGPNTYVVSKVTRKAGVKMALSGLGGDELFAGYDVFRRMKDIDSSIWLSRSPKVARSLAAGALNMFKPSVASEKIGEILRKTSLDFCSAYPVTRQIFMDKRISALLKRSILPLNEVERIAFMADKTGLPLYSKVSIAEISSYMQNVLLRDSDQMSMAHALEVRVPFIDHRLVEYTLGVSDEQKHPHTPKQLLVDSLGSLLPREIIDRPKMGFTFPWNLWMKNELKEMCEENLLFLSELDYFREGEIMKLWRKFLSGDVHVTWSRMWPLVVLGHWLKKHQII